MGRVRRGPAGPVLAVFPEDGEAPAQILQASGARKDVSNASGDPADELTGVRGYYERWNENHDGRTLVGLSGIPQRGFRGLVKYMQEFDPAEPTDYAKKPDGMTIPRFLRLASDDLKSFYMEARMCQRPDQHNNDLQRWFWTETAMGTMLSDLAGRLAASEEQPPSPWKASSTGLRLCMRCMYSASSRSRRISSRALAESRWGQPGQKVADRVATLIGLAAVWAIRCTVASSCPLVWIERA